MNVPRGGRNARDGRGARCRHGKETALPDEGRMGSRGGAQAAPAGQRPAAGVVDGLARRAAPDARAGASARRGEPLFTSGWPNASPRTACSDQGCSRSTTALRRGDVDSTTGPTSVSAPATDSAPPLITSTSTVWPSSSSTSISKLHRCPHPNTPGSRDVVPAAVALRHVPGLPLCVHSSGLPVKAFTSL